MPSPERDFLKESWRKLEAGTEQETLEPTPEDDALDLYLDILAKAEGYPEIAELLEDVEDNALGYAQRILAIERAHITDEDKLGWQRLDEARRYSHDAFIDSLNILSRAFRKAHLDNSWRERIGRSREAVGEWGYLFAASISRQTLKEKGVWP